MKTKLLRKVRKLHPFYFDSTTKKYKYQSLVGRECLGGIYEYDFVSEWVDDYKFLLPKRRSLILKDARLIFENSLFTYKRKRKPKIYRLL